MTPLVSIQIPTYNQAHLISKAIESSFMQTYSNLEIIIADDYSIDNTKQVINKYLKDQRVKYFCTKSNIGRVANYQKALYEYDKGDWVVNLDGDDYFTNANFIKNAIEKINEEQDNVLFFMGAHIYKNSNGEFVKEPYMKKDSLSISGYQFIKDLFGYRHFSHMSAIFNRNLATQSGFYESNIISSDLLSFLKLSVKNPKKRIILSKSVSGEWVQHEQNTSKSLKINEHVKNFNLYIIIFFEQLKSIEFPKLPSVIWFMKAFFYYWGWYIKNILLKKNVILRKG